MLRFIKKISFLAIILLLFQNAKKNDVWGFYSHKLINEKAIFLLPTELIPIFKVNLEELKHFSVAPDQRRHSSPHEAVRHYIDLDNWGVAPFSNVPRKYDRAVWKFGDIYFLNELDSDTLFIKEKATIQTSELRDSIMAFFYEEVRYADNDAKKWRLQGQSYFKEFPELNKYTHIYFHNILDEWGILPYHLMTYQNRLKWAFIDQDVPNIIRLAGEIGHYISDGHVPLHTTVNYNGQLTGQDGIHAFWETRIPELFATENYDFWTEPREYIEDKEKFFWDIILDSHDLVDEVLGREMELRNSFPKDNQYCFDERLGVTQRIECEEYARAYQNSLNGMVENRMRDAITAVASSWYTAWVDAGSPSLNIEKIDFNIFSEIEQEAIKTDSLKIRKANNE